MLPSFFHNLVKKSMPHVKRVFLFTDEGSAKRCRFGERENGKYRFQHEIIQNGSLAEIHYTPKHSD